MIKSPSLFLFIKVSWEGGGGVHAHFTSQVIPENESEKLYFSFRLLQARDFPDKRFALVIDGSSLRHALDGDRGKLLELWRGLL